MSTTNGQAISVSTANGYIEDFIDNFYDTGKVPVKSLIMDAGLLRSYLSDTTIENVKFMLGERTVDVNGTPTQTLTLIVAGYNQSGDYVLLPNNQILDNMAPCPTRCPSTGDAANDYIS